MRFDAANVYVRLVTRTAPNRTRTQRRMRNVERKKELVEANGNGIAWKAVCMAFACSLTRVLSVSDCTNCCSNLQ